MDITYSEHIDELVDHFYRIKEMGWIETTRHGDQCLGNAFEDLIGKEEDNLSKSDFYDIELKSHRITTKSYITLFSSAPSYPDKVNTYLRETYGVVEDDYGKKKLNTTVNGLKENTHRGGHNFKAVVNREEERIYLQIRDSSTKEIIDDKIYWTFDVLSSALKRKISKIAILYGDEKDENGKHYVRYTKMDFFTGLDMDKMLIALEKGDLVIDIRIGVYHSGKMAGKTHDHGTAFRIFLDKLLTYGNVISYE